MNPDKERRKTMKRSTLVMVLCLVLAVAMGVGSTMAYLQDTDEDVNVMTLGNVYIEQHEFERVVDEEGNYEIIRAEERGEDSYKLKDFTQAKPLYPATGEVTGWEETGVCFEQLDGNPLGKMTILDGLNNVQDKFVFVENTGKSDAYVRTIIAYEVGSDEDAYGDLIMTSTNTFWLENEIGVVKIDGNNYYVVEYLYDGNQYPEGGTKVANGNGKHPDGIVHPGEYTYNSLAQIYMKGKATNEDVEAIDGNKNGTYDILVVSQAVQAQGFADPKTALDTAFGVTSKDSHPWMDLDGKTDEEGDQAPDGAEFPVLVSTADELVAALEDGKDVHLTKNIKIDPASMSNAYGTTGINVKNGQAINGGGYTIDIKGAGGTWDSGINTTGGLIRDLTVTGSFRGIFINHNSTHSEPVILDNVTIEGTTYTISCDQGLNQTLTAKNSTFKGWTSFAATLGNATFIDCYFGEGNGYAYCRPYAPTAFVGCEFEEGYVVDPRAAVTFENCTLAGQPLTADNLADLVTNTANATVK